jgi:capsid protein
VAPKEDVETAERMLRLGLTSRQRLCAEQGVDFEEIIEELAHEKDVAEEAGIDISGVDTIRTNAPTLDEGAGDATTTAPDENTPPNENAPTNGNGANGQRQRTRAYAAPLRRAALQTP